MSYYNHMHDSADNKLKCINCGKKFTWVESENHYPGGKDTEYINCPYCKTSNGSIRTSGVVYTSKVEE